MQKMLVLQLCNQRFLHFWLLWTSLNHYWKATTPKSFLRFEAAVMYSQIQYYHKLGKENACGDD